MTKYRKELCIVSLEPQRDQFPLNLEGAMEFMYARQDWKEMREEFALKFSIQVTLKVA